MTVPSRDPKPKPRHHRKVCDVHGCMPVVPVFSTPSTLMTPDELAKPEIAWNALSVATWDKGVIDCTAAVLVVLGARRPMAILLTPRIHWSVAKLAVHSSAPVKVYGCEGATVVVVFNCDAAPAVQPVPAPPFTPVNK